jgi:hypothetical protein
LGHGLIVSSDAYDMMTNALTCAVQSLIEDPECLGRLEVTEALGKPAQFQLSLVVGLDSISARCRIERGGRGKPAG